MFLLAIAFVGLLIWANCFHEEEYTISDLCKDSCRECWRVLGGGGYDCDIDRDCYEDCMNNPRPFMPGEGIY